MTRINYEFPLNEKTRTYLRIEHLLTQLHQNANAGDQNALYQFFQALFSILEVIERGDLKSDLLKDLEKHEKKLVSWSQYPGVDSSALSGLLEQVLKASGELSKTGRLGQDFKDDKFLASIKQRFSIPGGTCCFDLPHLHYWLNQPSEVIQRELDRWLANLHLLTTVISTDLKFIRERGKAKNLIAKNGFYQDSVEHVELLQISVDSDANSHPTVSGHKHRFAIRFMQLDADMNKVATEADIQFMLSCC